MDSEQAIYELRHNGELITEVVSPNVRRARFINILNIRLEIAVLIETLQAKNERLEQQVDKMKNCSNCKLYWADCCHCTEGKYDKWVSKEEG